MFHFLGKQMGKLQSNHKPIETDPVMIDLIKRRVSKSEFPFLVIQREAFTKERRSENTFEYHQMKTDTLLSKLNDIIEEYEFIECDNTWADDPNIGISIEFASCDLNIKVRIFKLQQKIDIVEYTKGNKLFKKFICTY